jgi:hypothetical protein
MNRVKTHLITLLLSVAGLAAAPTASAGPIIDVRVNTPTVRLVAAPPPPVVVVQRPGYVWVPAHYRTDRYGRRVLVEGHYEPRGRTVKRKKVVVYR